MKEWKKGREERQKRTENRKDKIKGERKEKEEGLGGGGRK